MDHGAPGAACGETGVAVVPVKARRRCSRQPGDDFGGLFLGLSFFLIVAALLLMALIFQV